jgi:multicomponent Na+:H+ antiporter subunit D
MLLPAAILLAASIGLGFLPQLEPGASRAARLLTAPATYAAAVLDGTAWPVPPPAPPAPPAGVLARVLPPAAALGLAALTLFRDRLRPLPIGAAGRLLRALLKPLQAAHSGHVGDYVAWLMFGLAAFGAALTAAARL